MGVGISGLTLGGGLGHATRALGLMADSVLQATVVLPDGRVVTASPSSELDLFWVSGVDAKDLGVPVCSVHHRQCLKHCLSDSRSSRYHEADHNKRHSVLRSLPVRKWGL